MDEGDFTSLSSITFYFKISVKHRVPIDINHHLSFSSISSYEFASSTVLGLRGLMNRVAFSNRKKAEMRRRIPVVALCLAATCHYMFSGGARQATAHAEVTAGSMRQHTSGLYSTKHMEEMDALR